MSYKKITTVRAKVLEDISAREIPDCNEVQRVGWYSGVGMGNHPHGGIQWLH